MTHLHRSARTDRKPKKIKKKKRKKRTFHAIQFWIEKHLHQSLHSLLFAHILNIDE